MARSLSSALIARSIPKRFHLSSRRAVPPSSREPRNSNGQSPPICSCIWAASSGSRYRLMLRVSRQSSSRSSLSLRPKLYRTSVRTLPFGVFATQMTVAQCEKPAALGRGFLASRTLCYSLFNTSLTDRSISQFVSPMGTLVEGISRANTNTILGTLGAAIRTSATFHTDVATSSAFITQPTSPDTRRCGLPLPVHQVLPGTSLHRRFFHGHIRDRHAY